MRTIPTGTGHKSSPGFSRACPTVTINSCSQYSPISTPASIHPDVFVARLSPKGL